MYLKRIEAVGFKSFAQKVKIDFSQNINGVVGPNGCGKSNITDAIKWVLGEQSTKNLRASGMSDVIFAGSDAYKKQNYAQVTLVFDNSDHQLKIDYDEVAITRKLFRSGESEYLINKTSSRLKDIVELIMDTGLGKDSLSMISQGAIANFAEAKPDVRRLIFEEAAGVAKYKKRKIESLKKLEKTNENLVRIEDIISELEAQVLPLKRQATKAKLYLEKKEKLEAVEVSVIVSDVKKLEYDLQKAKDSLSQIMQDVVLYDSNLIFAEGKVEQLKAKIKECDNDLASLQTQLLKQVDLITNYEKQYNDEKNKVDKSSITSLDDLDFMKNKLDTYSFEITGLNNNITTFKSEVNDDKENLDKLKYNYEQLRENITRKQSSLQSYLSKRDVLKNISENKSNLFGGVKAILDNKHNLSGVNGIVSELFNVEDVYQEAMSKSLASSLQNIVVNDVDDAKQAVSFLKRNKAGRATFIPMNVLKPRYVNSDDLYIATTCEGYINTANNLISYDDKYDLVFKYLLNTTLIARNIDDANNLSKMLKQKYRIVTLEGDIVSVGGIITGGKQANERGNLISIKSDLEKLSNHIDDLNKQLNNDNDNLYKFENSLNDARNKINQKLISIAKLEENLSNKEYLFNDLKNQYQTLSNLNYQVDDSESYLSLIEQINEAKLLKERLLNSISSTRESHYEMSSDLEELELKLKENRLMINDLNNKHAHLNIEKTRNEITLKGLLDRLANEYQLTIDMASSIAIIKEDMVLAKEEVNRLKQEIKSLGMVNLLAIEEYERVSERFEFLTKQKDDLINAQEKILDSINESDKVMVERFSKTIEDINNELPHTFKKLFGGGNARLEYSDPTNILETGIEIKATPPGKSIQNINLFSGGEKALIALSVLFAILKVRPIPLCILDEVEAALDQANVERFARFLKEFSNTTQFIVITHRPGTMEQCDVLYGVTMQERGVTKLIGVQLEEAKELINQE